MYDFITEGVDIGYCDYHPVTNIVTMLHPWQRDTGKYAAQGPNIMSPEAPLMPPEARRAELEGRGRHQGAEGDIMWPAGGIFSSVPLPGV